MKRSGLTALAIPEQAKIIQTTSRDINWSGSYDFETGTIVKWSSGFILTGYPAGIMAFIGVGPWPGLAVGFGIASAIAGLFTLGSMYLDGSARKMSNGLRKVSLPIKPQEWKSQKDKPTNTYSEETYRGIKILHRSRRSIFAAAINPMRPFRKILLSETVWYHPSGDYFTKECHYMGLFNWVETKQLYAGRRRTFLHTLNGLEQKAEKSLTQKGKGKS